MKKKRDIIIKVIDNKNNIKICNRRLAEFFAKKYTEENKNDIK